LTTNTEAQQAFIRAVTGTAYDYNSDWSALFDLCDRAEAGVLDWLWPVACVVCFAIGIAIGWMVRDYAAEHDKNEHHDGGGAPP